MVWMMNYGLDDRRPVSAAGWDMEALTAKIPDVRFFKGNFAEQNSLTFAS